MRASLLISMLCIFLSFNSYSQCVDIFDNPVECPTEDDSLVVYNNALKVYEFYEKNPDYVKLKSQRLRTRKDVANCFYQLQNAVDSFSYRRMMRERVINGEDIPSVLLPRDGKNIPMSSYYLYVDAYRFYQRELENGILNVNSPFPIYDTRIAPLIVNSYENRSGSDEYNGDYVNVALYVPVIVKPVRLLTDSERIIRQTILNGGIPKKIDKPAKTDIKKSVVKNKKILSDTTLLTSASIVYIPPVINKEGLLKYTYPPNGAIPCYYQSPLGGGWLMGYMVKRNFRKFLSTDEYYYALPQFLKELLNDDESLEKYLRIKFGGYYDGLYTK